jgi:hypothetical protein
LDLANLLHTFIHTYTILSVTITALTEAFNSQFPLSSTNAGTSLSSAAAIFKLYSTTSRIQLNCLGVCIQPSYIGLLRTTQETAYIVGRVYRPIA